MSEIVDARGLSCPQPVLLVLSRIKQLGGGEFDVLIDNEVSRENVWAFAWPVSSGISPAASDFTGPPWCSICVRRSWALYWAPF